jgi:hypothetical protein
MFNRVKRVVTSMGDRKTVTLDAFLESLSAELIGSEGHIFIARDKGGKMDIEAIPFATLSIGKTWRAGVLTMGIEASHRKVLEDQHISGPCVLSQNPAQLFVARQLFTCFPENLA